MTSHVDTVSNAEQTPDHPQPFTELGLKDDEYARIREILGRRPTDAELRSYGEARSRRSRTGTAPRISDQFFLEAVETLSDAPERAVSSSSCRRGDSSRSSSRGVSLR